MGDFRELQSEALQLYGEGRYEDLLPIADRVQHDFPDRAATSFFWKACALARLGRSDEAVASLDQGLDEGSWWSREFLLEDDDLQLLADRADFQDLVRRSASIADTSPRDPEPPLVKGEGERGSITALHGSGDNPDTAVSAWGHAVTHGMQLIVARSNQRLAQDLYGWDKSAFGKDLRLTLEAANAVTPVVLGGFSAGASLSMGAALRDELAVDGVIAVCPTMRPGSSRVPTPEEMALAIARSDRGLRVFFVIGGKDPLGPAGLEAAEAMRATGYPVHIEYREELGHGFPSDFTELLPTALDFVLAED